MTLTASCGEASSTCSCSTSLMRRAEASDRVSSRKTLEIIIIEFMT